MALAALAALLALGASRPQPAPADPAFPVTLGQYSTTLVGSAPARTANILLAARALDGALLAPGEVLSFNRCVGARTHERGYQLAPVILREARDAQLGGGICQVASTVFVAALLTGLTPAQRFRHSFVVDYIPLGEDATISWGVKDLRIRNDLEQTVRLRVDVLGSTLTARFEGESELPESFELETVEVEAPAAGSQAPGREVELYRVRKADGQELDRELIHRDKYPPLLAREAPDAR